MMRSAEVLQAYHDAMHATDRDLEAQTRLYIPDPLEQGRPDSFSGFDGFFGDSGKANILLNANRVLARKRGRVISARPGGSANAGHEGQINGVSFITHQIPVAAVQDGGIAVITRGMVFHPEDFVYERDDLISKFGGLGGEIIIDERTPLALDTHRGYEKVLNAFERGGNGSTGMGVAPAYASITERHAVTVKDLLSDNWEGTLRKHYELYYMKTAGFRYHTNFENIEVVTMVDPRKRSYRRLGTENDFIDRLRDARFEVSRYARGNMDQFFAEHWGNPDIPFTFEGAQAAGLDLYHGVYPDVTASRPLTRFIGDATYGVVDPKDIAVKGATIKTIYVSSVGTRRLPTTFDAEYVAWVQNKYDERGRTSGRLRDIVEVSVPIAQYLRRIDGYDYLMATHLDAARENVPIRIITHYTDRDTGEEKPYMPYQDALDSLEPHYVEFPGWDGEALKGIRDPRELPRAAQVYIAFLNRTLAPMVMGTYDKEIGNYVSWSSSLQAA